MNSAQNKIKAPTGNLKTFKLIKYFIIIGLAVIFLAGVLITTLDNHWLGGMQRRQNTNFSKVLVENLNHQVVTQFILPVGLTYGKIQLRERNQFLLLDNVVRNTLHSFNVKNINIYDLDGTITYSWDVDLIGRQYMISDGYLKALEGETSEVLIERGSSWSFLFGVPREVAQVTFAPLFWEELGVTTGNILGVLEVTLDLSGDYREISNIEVLVSATSIALILGFFIILIYVVYRGEVIINHRNKAELKLRERLSRAEKFAAMGELTGSISHEIRNPLGIINSTAAMLKKRVAKTDPDNTLPDIIVEEATRLNNILTDFINFARPKPANKRVVHIEEIINKNISFLEPRLLETGSRIEADIAGNLPAIEADESMLYQAFLNIIINGLQAMETEAVITVRVYPQGEHILIQFDDNGPGVAEDVLGKIWDPFFTTKEQGTGLGLGIVKNIIDTHEGEIQIYNTEHGARVEIKLPTVADNAD